MTKFTWVLCLLFAAAHTQPPCVWGGPPEDTSADLVLDDFEHGLDWKAVIQNNIQIALDVPQALGHSGQASLMVTASSGAVGEKGRNAFRLQRSCAEGADWSQFMGIQLWIKSVQGGGDMFLCLHLPNGVRYRTTLNIVPADEGEWKFFRIPFDEFGWDFESAKTAEQKVDPKAVVAISLWRQMKPATKTVFYMDDVALYRQRPPYTGPTIALRSSTGKAMLRPDTDVMILGEVGRLQDAKDLSLKLTMRDFFDKVLFEKALPVVPDAKGAFAFEAPVGKAGYSRLDAVLERAGKTIYTETYSVARIPELSPAQKDGMRNGPQPSSLFGMWVGDIRFVVEQGAQWYRTYCEPWQFEPDGGGYRYIGKGRFPPQALPFGPATPICFFRGMSKWLTSRLDRVDYQKFPPKDWDEYARFVTYYVNNMKGLIKHWEVWNEPVPYAYWMGSIEEMVRLHEVTYKAVKAADPEAVVLGPCPYTFLFPFLEKFFDLGGGKWIDAVVIHAYTADAPEPGELDVNLKKVRDLANKYIGPRDLYVTELGWDSSRVGPTAQAQYLVRSHVLALEAGVKALIWHMYWDYKGSDSGDMGYAIVNHNQTPRPALVAYCTLMRMLTGMRFSRRLSDFQDPVRVYEFAGTGRKVTVAWCWKGTVKARIPVAAQRVELVNVVGNVSNPALVNGAMEMTLDQNPVYICE